MQAEWCQCVLVAGLRSGSVSAMHPPLFRVSTLAVSLTLLAWWRTTQVDALTTANQQLQFTAAQLPALQHEYDRLQAQAHDAERLQAAALDAKERVERLQEDARECDRLKAQVGRRHSTFLLLLGRVPCPMCVLAVGQGMGGDRMQSLAACTPPPLLT